MSKRKRRFNWDELSSEDEDIDTKKSTKKVKEAVINKSSIKEKQSPIKIETKDESKDNLSPNKRSTRTSIKREIEDDDNDVKSKILKSSTKQTSIKRELEDDDNQDKTPSKLIKSNRNIKKKEEEISSPPKSKQSISKKENKQIEDNTIVLDKNSQQEPNTEQIDSKYSDLPLITIKSIKVKFNKKQDSSKKFNKKRCFSPTKEATNNLLTKFKEVKIELNDDQRNWFNEQIQNYDGKYDAEFDTESKVHVKSTNSRSRR